ncbi:MAG: sulfotransferase [Marinoscillum sp.]
MSGIKVIYIGGYSRSGSTILDILLSNHAQIVGTGELCYLYDDSKNADRTCTCGQPYPKCNFWGDYLSSNDIDHASQIIKEVEGRSNFYRLLDGNIDRKLLDKYTVIQEGLYRYIAEKSGCSIIVDSSKTTRDMVGRPLALSRYTSLDLKMIHLLKNGKATTQSYVSKGRNWAMEGHGGNDMLQGMRSIFGWKLANKLALQTGKILDGAYLPLKYEDFVENPEISLRRLGDFVDLDFESLNKIVSSKQVIAPHHHVGGNRLRLKSNLSLKVGKPIAPDLDIFHSFAFNIIAGQLSKELGY